MIFGSVTVTSRAVETNRDSYLLENLSVISTRRPYLGAAIFFAFGFGGFAAAFADLLYAHEIKMIIGACAVILMGAVWLGQLKLLSRDLRGSELSGVIWGSYHHLNRVRRDVVVALHHPEQGASQ
jgi:hypothetical protein